MQKKEVPDEIEEDKISGDIPISRLLVEAGLTASRSEAGRLIQQGAVSIDGRQLACLSGRWILFKLLRISNFFLKYFQKVPIHIMNVF